MDFGPIRGQKPTNIKFLLCEDKKGFPHLHRSSSFTPFQNGRRGAGDQTTEPPSDGSLPRGQLVTTVLEQPIYSSYSGVVPFNYSSWVSLLVFVDSLVELLVAVF